MSIINCKKRDKAIDTDFNAEDIDDGICSECQTENPYITQLSSLNLILKDLYKDSRISIKSDWELLNKLSMKEYTKILSLIFSRRYSDLNEFLGSI